MCSDTGTSMLEGDDSSEEGQNGNQASQQHNQTFAASNVEKLFVIFTDAEQK
jgi:hypothetical protein